MGYLNDIYLYGIGVSRVSGRTDIYTSFEGRSAIISDAENPKEINPGFFHLINEHYSIKGSAFFGLNTD